MRTLLLCTVALIPGVALAQPEQPPSATDPTAHRHLGLLFRADLGPDYLTASASDGGLSVSLKNPGAAIGIVVGGAVSEDWILGLDLWGLSAFAPSISSGGQSASVGSQTMSLSGVGLNLTHYFMPANVYVSLSPSVTVLSISSDDGGATGSTHPGFGGRLVVGKEWWVGDHWGLGVAAEAVLGVNKDKGGGPTWTSFGGGLLFSATYN